MKVRTGMKAGCNVARGSYEPYPAVRGWGGHVA
jgi:hypothetical protein